MIRAKGIFIALLAFQTVYLCAALVIGNLPSWSMFANLENPIFTLTEMGTGRPIDAKAYMPAVHFEMGPYTLKKLAVFICQKEGIGLQLDIQTPVRTTTPSDTAAMKVESYEIAQGLCALQVR